MLRLYLLIYILDKRKLILRNGNEILYLNKDIIMMIMIQISMMMIMKKFLIDFSVSSQNSHKKFLENH